MSQFQKVQEIHGRMRSDSSFAEELKANPKDVFERELGKQLPADFNHASVEKIYPGFFQLEEIKLTPEQMDAIAGGAGQAKPGLCF